MTADHDDPDRNLLWLVQAGLGLPDRESYFDESADGAARGVRRAHRRPARATRASTGDGAAVLAFETRLAELHLRAEERRDTDRTHNRYDREALVALAPGLAGYLDALGAGAAESVNVENPRLLEGLQAVLDDTAPATLRAYFSFHVVKAVADALPRASTTRTSRSTGGGSAARRSSTSAPSA